MNKSKLGSVEILGFCGIILWITGSILRKYSLSDNIIYLFFIGSFPNLALAWFTTMLGKWIVLFGFKKDMTIKIHLYICVMIVVLGLASEIIYDLFFHNPFDKNDMLMTVGAQLFIFLVPVIANK